MGGVNKGKIIYSNYAYVWFNILAASFPEDLRKIVARQFSYEIKDVIV